MTAKQKQYAKSLRQRIMSRFAVTGQLEIRKDLMTAWGFGDSLRKLNIQQLLQIQNIQNGKTGTPSSSGTRNFSHSYNKQGKYIYHLAHKIGWDEKRLAYLLAHKFEKIHLNSLDEKETKQVIAILRSYVH